MNYAPIALFVFNRLDHLKQTIGSLMENKLASESHLFIYSDGPKLQEDISKVASVREFIKNVSGFKSVRISCSEVNKGLAASIVSGVTKLTSEFGKVIVLEDDIITSPFFLSYMNDALDLYSNEERVMHISGFMFPIEKYSHEGSMFLRPTTCWGWGTWSRAWNKYSKNIEVIEQKMTKDKIKDFNLDNSYDYYKQVEQNKSGKIKTWAIFWYASVYLEGGLSLHPTISLCCNIGLDGTGVNCGTSDRFNVQMDYEYKKLAPIDVFENSEARKKLVQYFSGLNLSFTKRLMRKLGIL